jgi:hypothetical protein
MALDLNDLSPQEKVAAIYIGYYDRAADPVGQEFWVRAEALPSLSLAEIASDFATQPETLAAYPFLGNPTEVEAEGFIAEVFLNLFNRAPDQAGLDFWSDALIGAINGTNDLSVGEIILSIIEGAQDSAAGNDLTTIRNKIEVSIAWTDAAAEEDVDYTSDTEAQASAKSIIEGVTDDASTVAAAKSTIEAFFDAELEALYAEAKASSDAAAATAEASLDAATSAQSDADAAEAAVTDLASAQAYEVAAQAAVDAAEVAVADAASAQAAAAAQQAAAAETSNADDDAEAQAAVDAADALAAGASDAQSTAAGELASAGAGIEAELEALYAEAKASSDAAAATAEASLDAATSAQSDADAAEAAVTDLASAQAYEAAAQAAVDAAEVAVADAASAQAAAAAQQAAAAETSNADDDAEAQAAVDAADALAAVASDAQSAAAGELASASDVVGSFTAQTIALTTGPDAGDAFVGDNGDDVFEAGLSGAIDGLVGAQTLQGADVLDGGAGTDTLNAELNNTGTTQNPSIENIEVYNLTSFGGLLGGNGQLDLDRASGYQQLWNRDSRTNLDLTNVGEVAILGLDNVRDSSAYNVNYDTVEVTEQTVVSMMSGRPGNLVTLNITGVDGVIGDMNLIVSDDNLLDLAGDAGNMLNLNISGSGLLGISNAGNFANLQTLDTLDYDGRMNIDVSGSGNLESVLTADGDDVVVVDHAAVNGGLSVDMGAGFDILNVNGVADETELNGIDFSGGVTGVENIAFDDQITLTGDAVLDLNGVSDELETLWFFNGFDADDEDLTLQNVPVGDLGIRAVGTGNQASFDMNGGLLTIDNVVNLTINALDDVDLDDGLNGNTIETLDVTAGDDIDIDLTDGLDALVSINATTTNTSSVTAGNSNASVDLDASSTKVGETNFGALETINVTGATDATLSMTGRSEVPFQAGTRATQSFEIGVSQAGLFGVNGAAGSVTFTSNSLASSPVTADYDFGGTLFADIEAASEIAQDLDAAPELVASTTVDEFVNVTWLDTGVVDPLTFTSNATRGTLSVTQVAFTQGTDEVAPVDGEGFAALDTVTVEAEGGDADVDLTDVYGMFALNVTASDDAEVDLTNTNVTTASVAAGSGAGDTATVSISGDVVGNAELVDLTVSGDQAVVTLADALDSFTTLDVSGVAADVDVDTSAAAFVVSAGGLIEYVIGATTDVAVTGNDVRELYNFVGDDIGQVAITDFTIGADPNTGDRLDLSAFAGNAAQLIFTVDANDDIVITDIDGGLGDFTGEIKIVGTFDADDAADLSAFNIFYG